MFKPTIGKIITAIVIALAHFFGIGVGFYCGWNSVSMALPQCKYFLMPLYSLLLLPSQLISKISDIRFNPFETSAHFIASGIVQIIWAYVLACLIIALVRKVRKQRANTV
jgi:hypothetical protein